MTRIKQALIAGALGAALSASALAAPTTLRASHQFPGGRGDVRDEMVQIIARDAKAANVELEVQVYPGASLFKPNEQWNALVNGQLDISSFPLDYASGKVRAFGATLMPGLVRSHERAARPARLSPRCGRRPARRSSRFRRTRSTTRCRPASPMRPTPARGASFRSA